MADYETGRFFPLSFLSLIANPTSAEKLLIRSHEVVRVARMVRAKVLSTTVLLFLSGIWGACLFTPQAVTALQRGWLRGRVGFGQGWLASPDACSDLPVQTLALTCSERVLLWSVV